MSYPKVSQDIVIQELGAECIVYVPSTAAAHSLSGPMALILKVCRGRLSEQSMFDNLELHDPATRTQVIQDSIAELRALGVVEPDVEGEAPVVNLNRRDFIRAATMAAAIPLVASVFVPLPAAAQSQCVANCNTAADGTPCDPNMAMPTDCSAGAQCAVQFTCNGPSSNNNMPNPCNPGACNNSTTDFPNANKVCVANNGTFIQDSCSSARMNAATPFMGSTQYTYVCKNCPS